MDIVRRWETRRTLECQNVTREYADGNRFGWHVVSCQSHGKVSFVGLHLVLFNIRCVTQQSPAYTQSNAQETGKTDSKWQWKALSKEYEKEDLHCFARYTHERP